MRNCLSILFAAPLALAASAAFGAASFAELDADKDGYVSKVEARKDRAVEAGFAAADRNKDGRLDRAEFATIVADASRERMDAGARQPAKTAK